MTAIVGLRWEGGALLAADSAVTGELRARERRPKVAKRDGYLVGACGGAAFCHAALRLSAKLRRGTLLDWAVETYLPKLREALAEEPDEGEIILASPGELVTISEAAVHDYADDYAAVGSGAAVALGALCVLPRVDALGRARAALAAASWLVPTVSAPWHYVTTAGGIGQL